MAMPEVAGEMKDAVDVFVGSEEVEPGPGWPYDTWLARVNAGATTQDVARALTEEYLKSYQGGTQGTSDVTLSAFDLTKTDQLLDSIRTLGAKLKSVSTGDKTRVKQAIAHTLNFTYSDYADLTDFLKQLETAQIAGVTRDVLSPIRTAAAQYVLSNQVSSEFARAGGLAVWLPASRYTFDEYAPAYRELEFHKSTAWADALQYLLN